MKKNSNTLSSFLFYFQNDCSFVPGPPVCVYWSEKDLAWSDEGCSVSPGLGLFDLEIWSLNLQIRTSGQARIST